jgi:hypothetical protein
VDYNIGLALELAKMGVKHIQFDYVRYYEKMGLDTHGKVRVDVITDFLKQANAAIKGYDKNITISADLFAVIAWEKHNESSVRIGQDLVKMAQYVDEIYLMAYPSHFGNIIPNSLRQRLILEGKPINAADYPKEIIEATCRYVTEKLKDNKNIKIGLYLQAYKYKNNDYPYCAQYVQDQMETAYNCGIRNILLWDPNNKYESAAYEAIGKFQETLLPLKEIKPHTNIRITLPLL